MKQKLPVFIAVFCALSSAPEVFAQARGSHYNPPGGGGSRSSGSSSSSSSSRGSSYNPPSHSSSSSSSSSSRGSSYSPSRPSSPSSSSSSSSSPRGPSYNPGRTTPSSPSSSSSTPRGPSYNPGRSTPSIPSTPRGPSYNPGRSTPSIPSTPSVPSTPRGPSYDPTPSRPSTPSVPSTPRGPSYDPTPSRPSTPSIPSGPVVRGPRYNPPIQHYPPVYHTPHVIVRPGVIIYPTPRAYYTQVRHVYIYRRWVREPVVFRYSDGYYDMDGYPYYVYHGYRNRYSPVEMCNYELVDGADNTTVRTYSQEVCNVAYDTCAVERDTMNRAIGVDRYFCAEAVDDDLQQTDTTSYQPSPVDISEAQSAAIQAFLAGKSKLDIFRAGPVGKCSIVKYGGLFSSGNKFGCKYVVKVSDEAFPLTDESICSDSEQAKAMNCDIGSEKENAGCIMQSAIESGYCL